VLLLGLARTSSTAFSCHALVKLLPLFEALHQPGTHGKARAQMPREWMAISWGQIDIIEHGIEKNPNFD
jgi:hypothetical protein